MSIAEIYRRRQAPQDSRAGRPRPAISFELFPPRDPNPHSAAWAGINRLLQAGPDYVSVTFGASGASQELSRQALGHVLRRTGSPGLAHLTCVGRDRNGLDRLVSELIADGTRDFLALRGDPPKGSREWTPQPGGLSRAAELVELIRAVAQRELGDARSVSIAVAAYPAGEALTRKNAVAALADKYAAGADFAITQVFYRSQDYRDLVDAAAERGVALPIVPGIIPFTDVARLRRLESLSGVGVPSELAGLSYIPDPRERLRATLSASLNFLDQLLLLGADSFHFYTFNRARPVLDLVGHLRSRGYGRVGPSESAQLLDLVSANLGRISP
ncbi:methylenetetrahydrofolate reductase [Dermabacteraceae bacterium P13095]